VRLFDELGDVAVWVIGNIGSVNTLFVVPVEPIGACAFVGSISVLAFRGFT
jgi:hypothetical protein